MFLELGEGEIEKSECFTHSTPWFRLQSGHQLIGNGLELLQEINDEMLAEMEGQRK